MSTSYTPKKAPVDQVVTAATNATYLGLLLTTAGIATIAANPFASTSSIGRKLAFSGVPFIVVGAIIALAFQSAKMHEITASKLLIPETPSSKKLLPTDEALEDATASSSFISNTARDTGPTMTVYKTPNTTGGMFLRWLSAFTLLTAAGFAIAAGKEVILGNVPTNQALNPNNLAHGQQIHVAIILTLLAAALAAAAAATEARLVLKSTPRLEQKKPPAAVSFFNPRSAAAAGVAMAAAGAMAGMYLPVIFAGAALTITGFLLQELALAHQKYQVAPKKDKAEKIHSVTKGLAAVGAAGAAAGIGTIMYQGQMPQHISPAVIASMTGVTLMVVMAIVSAVTQKATKKVNPYATAEEDVSYHEHHGGKTERSNSYADGETIYNEDGPQFTSPTIVYTRRSSEE